MRFLADAGISPKTVDFLKELGHEAVHVRTLGLARAVDSELVELARADSSVVVTFDLDFGDILALGVLDKPSVIICRLADERAEFVNQRLAKVLAERISDLWSASHGMTTNTIDWLEQDPKPGDEILIRVVESSQPSPPVKSFWF